MKKYASVFVCMMSAVSCIQARVALSFVDKEFDAFVHRVVIDERDKDFFKKYYERLEEKLEASNDQKRRTTRQYLYQTALVNLEKKHAVWHEEIETLFADVRLTLDESFDNVRDSTRRFLRWYGAYEEYLTAKMLAHHDQEPSGPRVVIKEKKKKESGVWDSIKTYASKVGQKVAVLYDKAKRSMVA